MVCARVPLTVSTTAFATSPVPRIVPTTPFLTDSNMPCFSSIGISLLSLCIKTPKTRKFGNWDEDQAEETRLRVGGDLAFIGYLLPKSCHCIGQCQLGGARFYKSADASAIVTCPTKNKSGR